MRFSPQVGWKSQWSRFFFTAWWHQQWPRQTLNYRKESCLIIGTFHAGTGDYKLALHESECEIITKPNPQERTKETWSQRTETSAHSKYRGSRRWTISPSWGLNQKGVTQRIHKQKCCSLFCLRNGSGTYSKWDIIVNIHVHESSGHGRKLSLPCPDSFLLQNGWFHKTWRTVDDSRMK